MSIAAFLMSRVVITQLALRNDSLRGILWVSRFVVPDAFVRRPSGSHRIASFGARVLHGVSVVGPQGWSTCNVRVVGYPAA